MKSVFKPMENKPRDRANVVFNKLLAQQKKPKNPFDDARSYTTPSMKETKPGPDFD